MRRAGRESSAPHMKSLIERSFMGFFILISAKNWSKKLGPKFWIEKILVKKFWQKIKVQLSSINRENWLKLTNQMIIFPYVSIIDSSINRENLRKSQNKIFPINGTQLYLSLAVSLFRENSDILDKKSFTSQKFWFIWCD